MTNTLHQLPSQQLRRRVRQLGVGNLSDAELLALVIGSGTNRTSAQALATELLEKVGGLDCLFQPEALPSDLEHFGESKRTRLQAIAELARRVAVEQRLKELHHFSTPEQVGMWGIEQLGQLVHEELWLIALDSKQAIRSIRRAAQGGQSGCATTSRDLLRLALHLGAAAFVLVHNHPSGDPSPSYEDAQMTVSLARAASLIELPLLDHVIVGNQSYSSLYELGLFDPLHPEKLPSLKKT
jgi:DNA repair protein RadC